MPGAGPPVRRGRRGRRTGAMIRVAQERISDLFGLAESEARRGPSPLPQRYVTLARRIGMRYNVRLLREYRDLYCRGCSAYWVEGRTVRTRLRGGRRVRTCLVCGRVRRVRTGAVVLPTAAIPEARRETSSPEPVLSDEESEVDLEPELDEGE